MNKDCLVFDVCWCLFGSIYDTEVLTLEFLFLEKMIEKKRAVLSSNIFVLVVLREVLFRLVAEIKITRVKCCTSL